MNLFRSYQQPSVMKDFLIQMAVRSRRILWALTVAFMIGMHNFYRGEDKSPDNFGTTIEMIDVRQDGAPED